MLLLDYFRVRRALAAIAREDLFEGSDWGVEVSRRLLHEHREAFASVVPVWRPEHERRHAVHEGPLDEQMGAQT